MRGKFVIAVAAAILPSCVGAQSSAQPGSGKDVVQFHGTIDNVKYVFGVATPVARVKPGSILEANALDCFGNAL